MGRPKGSKNKKKNAPQIPKAPNNASRDYKAAWELEYNKLNEVQKLIIDNARTESVHGAYVRHYFVDLFVQRVIALVEMPVTEKGE